MHLEHGELILHDCGSSHNYDVYDWKPVNHVFSIGLKIANERSLEQKNTQEISAKRTDGSKEHTGQVVRDEGHNKDKEPESIHSDGPVSFHDKMYKKNN